MTTKRDPKVLDLENYIHEQIPISQALGVSVVEANLDQIILSAVFKNNINHKSTVFGGSLHAVCTLACWSLVYLNLKQLEKNYEVVITKSTIQYLLPVKNDFKSIATVDRSDAGWQKFLKILERKNKSKITLSAKITQAGQPAVQYFGTFAGLLKQKNN